MDFNFAEQKVKENNRVKIWVRLRPRGLTVGWKEA